MIFRFPHISCLWCFIIWCKCFKPLSNTPSVEFLAYISLALFQDAAVTGDTGYPSLAYLTAGAKTSDKDSFPNSLFNSAQAPGAPGTVTGIKPYFGISSCPRSLTASIEIDFGAGPLEFRPCNFPFVQTIANASLPIPFDVGSNTVRAAAVATAASIALPPFFKISSPACAASGCDVATIPFLAKTARRRIGYG